MRTSLLPFLASSCLVLVAGCGVRTALEIGSDAGPRSGSDGGRFDVGPIPIDGGRCRTTADCNDDLTCNGFEECIGGSCVRGPSIDCNDFVDCTVDQCIEGAGCIARPVDEMCPPGTRCDPFAGCTPLVTGCREDWECEDGLVCNGNELCDRATGTCFSTGAPSCDDGVGCTQDECVEGLGCVNEARPGLCAPPTICDRFTGCVLRPCTSPIDCDDGDLCNGAEQCGAAGLCVSGSPLNCDDGSSCTADRCLPFSGCISLIQPELCDDGIDNDCNGLADCGDFACSGRPECGCVPTSRIEVRCSDGRDDDCDGTTDCSDRDCLRTPDCGACAPFEVSCRDGRDDDCDGLFDCADFDCSGRPECGGCMPIGDRELGCLDMRDDDCDGLFDCADPDCGGRPECGPCAFDELDCFNGRDDDCDGLFDCDDDSCRAAPGCGCFPTSMVERNCRDGIDDDCDGRIDCVDPDCFGRPGCGVDAGVRDGGPPVPRDAGVPRDGGFRDSGGDSGVVVLRELGVALCTNGVDDDRDGRADCADPDCSPFGPTGECCNDRDDNGDGNVDEFTCRCFEDSICADHGSLEQVCWATTYSVCAPNCAFYGGDSFCRMLVPDSPRCDRATGECVD